jgi:hypothetical protein
MAAKVGKVVWIGRVLSWLVSLAFLMSAFMKFKGGPELADGMAHLGLPDAMIRPLAILELACVAIYLIPATAVLGAILLAGYLGGAICVHWRVGDDLYTQIALGVVVWLGVWLRDARLRSLLPFRTWPT